MKYERILMQVDMIHRDMTTMLTVKMGTEGKDFMKMKEDLRSLNRFCLKNTMLPSKELMRLVFLMRGYLYRHFRDSGAFESINKKLDVMQLELTNLINKPIKER